MLNHPAIFKQNQSIFLSLLKACIQLIMLYNKRTYLKKGM
jgi:hypothetical protein